MPSRAYARVLLILALAAVGCGWAVAAWAQAEIASKAADSFLSRGNYEAIVVALVLAIVAGAGISGAVIRFLYNENKALNARIGELGERTIKALEDSTNADERTREVLQRMTSQLETRSATLGELSNLITMNGQAIGHGFGNVTQILEGILKALSEPRALALALADRIRLIWRNKGQGEDDA